MGSKRPDQYNVDADYESRVSDEHILEEDKQELRSNPHDQPMIPKAGTNPELRKMQERQHGDEGRGTGDRGPDEGRDMGEGDEEG